MIFFFFNFSKLLQTVFFWYGIFLFWTTWCCLMGMIPFSPTTDHFLFWLPQWFTLLITETISPIFLLLDFKRWMPMTGWISLLPLYQGPPGRTLVFPNADIFNLCFLKAGSFKIPPQFLKLWALYSVVWVFCFSVWTPHEAIHACISPPWFRFPKFYSI